jgi:hypothetical protein
MLAPEPTRPGKIAAGRAESIKTSLLFFVVCGFVRVDGSDIRA